MEATRKSRGVLEPDLQSDFQHAHGSRLAIGQEAQRRLEPNPAEIAPHGGAHVLLEDAMQMKLGHTCCSRYVVEVQGLAKIGCDVASRAVHGFQPVRGGQRRTTLDQPRRKELRGSLCVHTTRPSTGCHFTGPF